MRERIGARSSPIPRTGNRCVALSLLVPYVITALFAPVPGLPDTSREILPALSRSIARAADRPLRPVIGCERE
jgi:hypothetical protein